MSNVVHHYFGEICLSHNGLCIWEQEIHLPHLNGYPIELLLWVDEKNLMPNQEFLDKLANHFQKIDELHHKAKIALVDYLDKDDEIIDFYVDEIDAYDLPQLKELVDKNILTHERFVDLLQLNSVSGWFGSECEIVMDYMLDANQSDQILAVKFDLNGNVLEIDWES